MESWKRVFSSDIIWQLILYACFENIERISLLKGLVEEFSIIKGN